MNHFDVIVVGSGLVGSVFALGVAKQGFSTALVSPSSDFKDFRTTMLMDEGICFLKDMGLWDSINHVATPVSAIKLIDITDGFITSPDAIFRSDEIGLDVFGYNFPNHVLMDILKKEIYQNSLVHCFDDLATDMQVDETVVTITLSTGQKISGELLVGSDGRNSQVRQKLGFGEKKWAYPQTAIVLNFKHSIPHNGLCTEFHRFPGPVTQVPLNDNCSSLVWIMDPKEAEFYMKLSLEEVSHGIEKYMHSILGHIEIITEIQSFPLSGMISHRFGKDQTILIGEAAHSLPPICAQGLNLSIRDIIVLLDLIQKNKTSFKHIGNYFHFMRRGDIIRRVVGTDLFNRSLFTKYPFLPILRAGTFKILNRIIPLRHQVMRKSLFLRDI
ncbi:MAG: 2-octaprenyl-6-methoxyphenyl hydroxylase [Candidatus Liberibacter europaeus]|uniref:2-octaprenyl-6-methoxyphenyl hydroxylase n=1 Tax=Candidatus Liberibacter europaeus TaxID=744859 RepID=A0A2T4VX06_9HYPH|nr:2-octaprenyl-6-methoxyphenyl hydroxylase [Candidatus Liberibacter europaeus]PTL86307.1 MAG: 2-octaprenyl-6-methoxyphenyl hydroxylase [Candidatus Liberibacter europaeus]